MQLDGLSKKGLQLDPSRWQIWEEVDGQVSTYLHASFF
jgi:hypothetical protein